MNWLNIAKKNNIYVESVNKNTKQQKDDVEKNNIIEKYYFDINDIIWELLCDIKEVPNLLTTNRNHYALLRDIYEKHIDLDRHYYDETYDEVNDETYEDFVTWNKNRFAYN